MKSPSLLPAAYRPGPSAWRSLRRVIGAVVPIAMLASVMPALHAQAPVFTRQPVSQGVLINTAATLSVAVTGVPTPTLQWYRAGAPLTGKTAATLSIPSASLADGGTYHVVATNSLGTVRSADATLTVLPGLERFGPLMSLRSTPTNPRPGYPEWYQDTTGLALELLTPKSATELQSGYDVILPADTTFDPALGGEPFPTGWFLEHFYWFARSEFNIGASRGRLNLALEASYGNAVNVVPGDEVVFTRIRFDLPSAPLAGDYLIRTPYSEHEVKNVVLGGKIRVVEDVGIAPPPAGFAQSLRSKVGPFLTAADALGNELPLHTGPDGLKYLANPVRVGPVTGSPFGADRNAVKVYHKPSGTTTTYPQTPTWSSTDFVLYGRVKTTAIPTRTSVDRVTKTVSGTDRRLDVFASADETLPVRLPPAARSVKRTPVLSFVVPGTTTKVTMASSFDPTISPAPTTYYWYQWPMTLAQSNSVALGTTVSVVDDSDPTTPAVFNGPVRDAVWSIAAANPVALYTPATKALVIKCYSSTGAIAATAVPAVMSPDLMQFRAATYASGAITVPAVVAPPAEILVVSPGGGSEIFQVTTAKK